MDVLEKRIEHLERTVANLRSELHTLPRAGQYRLSQRTEQDSLHHREDPGGTVQRARGLLGKGRADAGEHDRAAGGPRSDSQVDRHPRPLRPDQHQSRLALPRECPFGLARPDRADGLGRVPGVALRWPLCGRRQTGGRGPDGRGPGRRSEFGRPRAGPRTARPALGRPGRSASPYHGSWGLVLEMAARSGTGASGCACG